MLCTTFCWRTVWTPIIVIDWTKRREKTMANGKKATTSAGWQPRFTLDLATARGKAFEEITDEFEEWRQEHPLPPLDLEDGWHTITPQAGANRKANLGTVLYYGTQMKRNDWPKTGQPLIFDEDGNLVDGQHRLWASYLANTVFSTYVVTNVPKHKRLFAYIDNGKVRSAANALQTSGMNGVSTLIVKVLDYAYAYENGLFSINSVQKRERMSPVQYLDSLEAHPTARIAAKLAVTDYADASELADRQVVGFTAMMLMDLYDDETAEKFLNELGGVNDTEEGGAVDLLRRVLQKDALKLKDGMKTHQILGNVIKAFNMWIAKEVPKKNWTLRTDENFPFFAEPNPVAQAAE
jgi:hypothetical protein